MPGNEAEAAILLDVYLERENRDPSRTSATLVG